LMMRCVATVRTTLTCVVSGRLRARGRPMQPECAGSRITMQGFSTVVYP
jgi:hypothetical protein